MMKLFSKLLIIFALFVSCSSDDNKELTCNVAQPLEDLAWLKSEIEGLKQFSNYQYQYVLQSNYNEGTVFIFANCCPICNSILTVYNCKGELLGSIGGDDIPVSVFENGKLLWKSENNECSF